MQQAENASGSNGDFPFKGSLMFFLSCNRRELAEPKLGIFKVLIFCGLAATIVQTPRLLAQPDLNPDLLAEVPPVEKSSRSTVLDVKLSNEVSAWLAQLENGSTKEKEAAEQELLKMGPAILSHLPRFPSSVINDYRTTLDRIRDSMQFKAIGDYSLPSTVTLKGKMPASDVLLEIMEQTDNQLTIEKLPAREMDVNFEQVTFWEALDSVLDELGLEATTSAQDALLKLVPVTTEGVRSVRGSYAGVFRIEPVEVGATRSMRSGQLSHLSLDISLMWEPRLKPVFFTFPMKNLLVECDNGEVLEATSPDSSPEYTPISNHSVEATLMMQLPSRRAKSIRRLSGTVLAAIPGAMVQLEFDDLEKAGSKTQKVGNLNVTVEEMKSLEDIYEFKLLISLKDAGQTMDSYRGWLMTHEAYVMDANDKRIDNAGWQTYQMNSEAVGLKYFFGLPPSLKGCRLIYSAPGAVSEQRVDFILKDIPLP